MNVKSREIDDYNHILLDFHTRIDTQQQQRQLDAAATAKSLDLFPQIFQNFLSKKRYLCVYVGSRYNFSINMSFPLVRYYDTTILLSHSTTNNTAVIANY